MKFLSLLACLLFAATLSAQPSQPTQTAPAAAPAKDAKKPAKAEKAKTTTKAKDAKIEKAEKPKEVEPTIPGTTIPRAKGGYLGLTIEDGLFRLAFYDEKKKAVDADADQAVMRWLVKYQKSDERTSLTRTSDGKALGGGKIVRPPYFFKLFITLFRGEGEAMQTDENYVIDFQG
jgi:hypothetical protein